MRGTRDVPAGARVKTQRCIWKAVPEGTCEFHWNEIATNVYFCLFASVELGSTKLSK